MGSSRSVIDFEVILVAGKFELKHHGKPHYQKYGNLPPPGAPEHGNPNDPVTPPPPKDYKPKPVLRQVFTSRSWVDLHADSPPLFYRTSDQQIWKVYRHFKSKALVTEQWPSGKREDYSSRRLSKLFNQRRAKNVLRRDLPEILLKPKKYTLGHGRFNEMSWADME